MTDREKVIKALTECIFLHENPKDDAGCLECPYRPDEKGTCPTMIPFLKDVLELLKDDETQLIYRDEIIKAHEDEIERLNELLKEQEPIPCGEKIKAGDVVLDFYECGYCKNAIRKPWRYCPFCGKAVKWDE